MSVKEFVPKAISSLLPESCLHCIINLRTGPEVQGLLKNKQFLETSSLPCATTLFPPLDRIRRQVRMAVYAHGPVRREGNVHAHCGHVCKESSRYNGCHK